MKVKLVWFDSLGAKSSCTFVKTKDISIIIDPGVSRMHPSFPGGEEKMRWYEKGKREVRKYFEKAEVVVISHYHWDHFWREGSYEGKIVFAKNPNKFINKSQRERAVRFFGEVLGIIQELNSYTIQEIPGRVLFPEGRRFRFGETVIEFSKPMFHGKENSRLGWVFMTTVREKKVLLHSSDLNGPIIESYAEEIKRISPDFIILDGPPTYLLGYNLSKKNLERAIKNVIDIIKKTSFEVLIWDHHLPREPRFRERTKEVWNLAKELKKNVMTASEYEFGKKPVVERFLKERRS